ncbi:MAG: polysaccharide biosynthesis tyrosine autokinase [Clostridia bacterium]|nr:polysaccharide biosynthesis tyrosine autokinase [Clostridia bacterium]
MEIRRATQKARRAQDEPGVNLEVILFNIARSWWAILIGCVIAAMISYIFVAERYAPKYYTEATFVVSSKDGGADQVYSNLVVASKLADSFTSVLESPVLRQKIAETLDMEDFEGEITAKNISNTNLIQIGVEASSPQLAFEEINAIIKNHHIVSDNIMGNAVLDVLKAPTVPMEPVKEMERPKKVLLFTALAAAAIITVIAVMSAVSDEIMTEADLESRVGCPALATIYHERKNMSLRSRLRGMKTSMLITNPTTSFRFAETYRLFRTRLEYLMKQRGHKVIMVSSVLENEGKTTSAANTAITLALNNRRVLLVDGDMLKPALYKILNTRIKRGMAINEIIDSDTDLSEIPAYEGIPTLSLLLGKTALKNSTELIGSELMKDLIARAKERFDYIVIDTPPMALATDAECFAELADCTLLVIKQGCARAKRINECIDSISQSGTDILGCIFNNVYPLEYLSGSSSEKQYGNSYRTVHDGMRDRGYGDGANAARAEGGELDER